MKAILICLALLSWLLPAFGQSLAVEPPRVQFRDTADFWYKWAKGRERQAGLKSIESSVHPFHFRIADTSGKVLDIWQQDNQFQGILTMWVKQVDDALEKLERIYSQQYALNSTQASAIGELVKKSGIRELPSQKQIPGWRQGTDGVEVVVQYIDNNVYRFKNYWTPSAQHDLAEALLVQQFFTKSFELANAGIVRNSFVSGIPFRCYAADGIIFSCKNVSTAEYWQSKQEVKRYLRQHKENN